MSKRKVVYQNWIVDLGFDQVLFGYEISSGLDSTASEKIEKAVRVSLDKLDENEKELIIHYYFMGQTYAEISEKSNREIFKLTALHKRAIKKLKKSLSKFVEDNFGITTESYINCPICNHDKREELNQIIFSRDKTKTWKPILKKLREKFQVDLRTPQLIIGHEKYHM
jgi:hypothetical protein